MFLDVEMRLVILHSIYSSVTAWTTNPAPGPLGSWIKLLGRVHPSRWVTLCTARELVTGAARTGRRRRSDPALRRPRAQHIAQTPLVTYLATSVRETTERMDRVQELLPKQLERYQDTT